MLSRKTLCLMALAGLMAGACSHFGSGSGGQARFPASADTWRNASAVAASSSQIANLSSGGKMSFTRAELITDNHRSFQRKLDIIRGAKRELRLVYFIYNDDYTSSVFTTEILAAAQRGVKVSLLVDFITNYDRLDLFSYMEKAGQGNVKVAFYGLPTETIQRGAVYQTLPCSKGAVNSPEQCQSEKKALIMQMGNPQSTWFSKMFLTGLYGKNPALMQAAIGIGGQFDPKTLASGANSSTPEEKAALKKFAKLVLAAKMKNDIAAKMKVAIALQTYGSTLNPIMNELTGRLPLVNGNFQDWDHITDYTHHKLIIADGEKFQLGGRNIEDSYHTDNIKSQIREAKGKYTFMDTDFYAETTDARGIEASYDRLMAFSPMVGDLAKVQATVPNEYEVNTEAFRLSLGACLQEGKSTPQEIEACVDFKMPGQRGYLNYTARMEAVSKNMGSKSQTYASTYKVKTDRPWKTGGDSLEASDLASAEAYYLENLSFTKNNPGKRLFGSKIGLEAENGKYLHAAWMKGLENTCATSSKLKQNKRVVIHSAYFFLNSGLVNALGNMINGKWKCNYVDVILITNSFQTTDLNIINIFARYQLQALFSFNQSIEKNPSYVTANQYKARFRYYEYAPSSEGAGYSLHSKVSVLGDDMIVGSANADVRSYYMDTNNAVYIRNAPQMVAAYNAFIDKIIADKRVVDFTSYYANVSNNHFVAENQAILRALLEKYDQKGRVNLQRQAQILAYVDQLGGKINSTTTAILSSHLTLNSGGDSETNGTAQKMTELDSLANSFDAFWKVL